MSAVNGPRSWWLRPDGDDQPELLVRSSPAGPGLQPGRRVRILGLRADIDPETGQGRIAASAGVTTEVFTMTAPPAS